MSKDILFTCYRYRFTDGLSTIFLFWPNGEWDENKYVIEEAIVAYPPSKYNWIKEEN